MKLLFKIVYHLGHSLAVFAMTIGIFGVPILWLGWAFDKNFYTAINGIYLPIGWSILVIIGGILVFVYSDIKDYQMEHYQRCPQCGIWLKFAVHADSDGERDWWVSYSYCKCGYKTENQIKYIP